MHLPLFFASSLAQVALAAALHRPEVEHITERNLTALAQPLLPPPVNGTLRLASFRPAKLGFARVAERHDKLDSNDSVFARNSDFFNLPAANIAAVEPSDRLGTPYISIGKVFRRNRNGSVAGTCTGTLVGSSLLLTASHCVEGMAADSSLDFVPGYDGTAHNLPPPLGKRVGVDKCYGLYSDADVDSAPLAGRDYVVCVLLEPIGLSVGYLGTITWVLNDPKSREKTYLSHTWSSAGYPKDRENGQVLIRADNIAIGHVQAGEAFPGQNVLTTYAYADYGWSGGPLYGLDSATGDAELIGTLSAVHEVTTKGLVMLTSAVHSGGPRLIKLVAWARCEWPGWPGECDRS
jgi:hypothetical protein